MIFGSPGPLNTGRSSEGANEGKKSMSNFPYAKPIASFIIAPTRSTTSSGTLGWLRPAFCATAQASASRLKNRMCSFDESASIAFVSLESVAWDSRVRGGPEQYICQVCVCCERKIESVDISKRNRRRGA